ncbi:MFS transporter [Bacillus sp. CGMCC 1.16607]|uniref:MFS transporter n=1 Tax=Bacillus sp. CGMCC 1.16607 TaxID=3351842 RepID=UPI00363B1E62
MLWTEKKRMYALTKGTQPSVWQNSNFVILFISGAIFSIGSKIYELALPLILYQNTNSAVVMSTMRGIEFLPNLLLAMFIGVLVDRAHKKRWYLWAVLFQILILFGLFFSIEYGKTSNLMFYSCGFLLMTFSYASFNARASIVKLSLPNEMLTSANASFNFIFTLIGIMGPAITGVILMLSNLHLGLLMTAVAFSFTFFILMLLKTDESSSRSVKKGFWKELREGWVELYRNKTLWLITITVVFLNSTAGMVDTTVIFYAKDVLRLTDAKLGLLLSFAGIGGLIGSLIVGKVRARWSTGPIIVVTTLLIGFSYLFLFSEIYILVGMGLLLNGLFGTISNVCVWTFRQESTEQHMIGRISGITGSIFKLGMPFAIFAAGWISDLSNPSFVFILAFIGNIFIFIIGRFSQLWNK